MPISSELRADGLHIEGYANVPGRESRPVMTPRGRVVEIIEPHAFENALAGAGEVRMLLDHDSARVLASRSAGTLDIHEDPVGLRVKAIVTDEEVIGMARRGELRGWSFNIRNPEDTVEEREGKLPLRRIKSLSMDEVSLIARRMPVYSSTVVEVRAGEEGGEGEAVEYRGEIGAAFTDMTGPDKLEAPGGPGGGKPKAIQEELNKRILAVRL